MIYCGIKMKMKTKSKMKTKIEPSESRLARANFWQP